MTSRLAASLVVATLSLVACGGGDDAGSESIPEFTLATTSTTTTTSVVPATLVEDTTATTEATTTTAAATSTTSPATTTTPTTPPTTEPPGVAAGLSLEANGLGSLAFGADPEQTIAFVTSVFGFPTGDTGWIPPFELGSCGGTRARQVAWQQLILEFGDASPVTEGRDHFSSYTYGAPNTIGVAPAGLETSAGIGIGSTVADLLRAYPGVTLFAGDEFGPPSFRVNDDLSGRITGLTDADRVDVVVGGVPCEG